MPSARAMRTFFAAVSTLAALAPLPHPAAGADGGDAAADAAPASAGASVTRLIEAYPEAIARIDGNWLVWRDGTRMALDDGAGEKPFEAWLATPDIEDMLRLPYPAGAGPLVPEPGSDPGRARNAAFFAKMYGDCRKDEVRTKLKTIVWLPAKARQRLDVTTVNGVADRLEAVSRELDALPPAFDAYLAPAAGTYACRTIAGTDRLSAHGAGIAIDIAVGRSDYWRWSPGAARGEIAYRNRIPLEIVHIFEQHGFIWGGRWHHYDTMHFEYRPELLPPLTPLDGANGPGQAPEK